MNTTLVLMRSPPPPPPPPEHHGRRNSTVRSSSTPSILQKPGRLLVMTTTSTPTTVAVAIAANDPFFSRPIIPPCPIPPPSTHSILRCRIPTQNSLGPWSLSARYPAELELRTPIPYRCRLNCRCPGPDTAC
ncbi:hypothetical protein CGLO_00981 [Colletotrichum gloeosporioides Cg-14]|uniref:Uncharacterized protein n=1 Tax=Colletotrichum gloeosporioides (strain Cg-14) TaxID=1237896 RepID=T0M5B4_COLGC|nr:hypothetical protein CGLO_00981 [Colletotrichum gloeosporioides Cg-14]